MEDPIAELLRGRGDADARYRALEAEYGGTLVREASIQTLVAIFIRLGIISKNDFVDGLEYQLKFYDEQRRQAAERAAS